MDQKDTLGEGVRNLRKLNLYAGIGGNRKYWEGQVTAVEMDKNIAATYQRLYPDDTVVVGDALGYLERHYAEFDFIWASPPCQTHGQYRHNVGVLGKGFRPIIPDMSLYAIILFLKTYFAGKYAVENVVPYYAYLIPPTIILQRHPIWANFAIAPRGFRTDKIRSKNKISDFEGYEVLSNSGIKNKRQVLRNCVDPEIGRYVIQEAFMSKEER